MGSANDPGPSRLPSRRGFEITIICALPIEADAVYATFDVRWNKIRILIGMLPVP